MRNKEFFNNTRWRSRTVRRPDWECKSLDILHHLHFTTDQYWIQLFVILKFWKYYTFRTRKLRNRSWKKNSRNVFCQQSLEKIRRKNLGMVILSFVYPCLGLLLRPHPIFGWNMSSNSNGDKMKYQALTRTQGAPI